MAAQNGYFRLNIKSNGVYLVLIPPEGGEPLQFSEVDDYLAAKKIDYNKKVVLDTINSNFCSIFTCRNISSKF